MRGYLFSEAKGWFWEGKLAYVHLKADILYGAEKDRLATQRIGTGVGGGYSFFGSSAWDLKLGLLAVIPFSESGTETDDWPEFQEQPEAHLVNDVLGDVFFKVDASVGYRF